MKQREDGLLFYHNKSEVILDCCFLAERMDLKTVIPHCRKDVYAAGFHRRDGLTGKAALLHTAFLTFFAGAAAKGNDLVVII